MTNIIAKYKEGDGVLMFQGVSAYTEVTVSDVVYIRISVADQTIDLAKSKYQLIVTAIGS